MFCLGDRCERGELGQELHVPPPGGPWRRMRRGIGWVSVVLSESLVLICIVTTRVSNSLHMKLIQME
jgi:hypothetical protein